MSGASAAGAYAKRVRELDELDKLRALARLVAAARTYDDNGSPVEEVAQRILREFAP